MKTTEQAPDITHAHLRIARPSDNLDAVMAFYHDGLGFELLARLEDHDGFDGIMLGHLDAGYHLEFTRERGCSAGRAPTAEHLLVFYLPDRAEWARSVRKLESIGCAAVASHNPYWDKCGKTYEDSDGYRVVLQNGAWG